MGDIVNMQDVKNGKISDIEWAFVGKRKDGTTYPQKVWQNLELVLKKHNINNEINIDKLDYFNSAKVKTEKLIMKKCKNYTIVRVPLVLSDLRTDPFLYNIKKGSYIECITKEDAAYAFCKIIDKDKIVNKKVLDIGLIRVNFNDLINNILKYHGISFKYILSTIFEEKNYYSPVLSNSEKSNEILKYKNDSIESYYMRLKRRSRKRKINILIGRIILKIKRVK